MVHFLQVRQFVEDDVVAHESRGLKQAPVERNRAAPGTGTPAGTLVAHSYARDAQLMPRRQFENSGRQLPGSQLPEMPLDGGAQVARPVRNPRHFPSEADDGPFASARRFQSDPFAAEEEFTASHPCVWAVLLMGLAQKLLFQPWYVSFRELSGFHVGAAARDGHTGRPIRVQPQDVAPRLGAADQPQAQAARADEQPIRLGSSGLFRAEK